MKILVFAKNNHWGDLAINYLKSHQAEIVMFRGDHGDPYPKIDYEVESDLIISFSSPWIIKDDLLKTATLAAINFHPGSPEYPGIGCTNFALYENAKNYGVTCHHMNPSVDTGKIIATKYFPIYENDTVLTLTDRTYAYLYLLYTDVLNSIFDQHKIPESTEHWKRRPFTRNELNQLCIIDQSMHKEEISRRIRAVTYPGKPGAFLSIENHKFIYSD